jgi:hypothetical protein
MYYDAECSRVELVRDLTQNEFEKYTILNIAEC